MTGGASQRPYLSYLYKVMGTYEESVQGSDRHLAFDRSDRCISIIYCKS